MEQVYWNFQTKKGEKLVMKLPLINMGYLGKKLVKIGKFEYVNTPQFILKNTVLEQFVPKIQ